MRFFSDYGSKKQLRYWYLMTQLLLIRFLMAKNIAGPLIFISYIIWNVHETNITRLSRPVQSIRTGWKRACLDDLWSRSNGAGMATMTSRGGTMVSNEELRAHHRLMNSTNSLKLHSSNSPHSSLTHISTLFFDSTAHCQKI